jgi:hypothetical protein
VFLVNGLAEEVIHRAFIFGHLRQTRPFRMAAAISAVVFAAQHAYLLFIVGVVAGTVSMLLALIVAFPLAFLYERGGRSLGAPAILHTSSNAPMMLFTIPDGPGPVTVAHMAVVLISMCLSLAFGPWLEAEGAGPYDKALCPLSSDAGSRHETAERQTASNSPGMGAEVGNEQAGHAAPMGTGRTTDQDAAQGAHREPDGADGGRRVG